MRVLLDLLKHGCFFLQLFCTSLLVCKIHRFFVTRPCVISISQNKCTHLRFSQHNRVRHLCSTKSVHTPFPVFEAQPYLAFALPTPDKISAQPLFGLLSITVSDIFVRQNQCTHTRCFGTTPQQKLNYPSTLSPFPFVNRLPAVKTRCNKVLHLRVLGFSFSLSPSVWRTTRYHSATLRSHGRRGQ